MDGKIMRVCWKLKYGAPIEDVAQLVKKFDVDSPIWLDQEDEKLWLCFGLERILIAVQNPNYRRLSLQEMQNAAHRGIKLSWPSKWDYGEISDQDHAKILDFFDGPPAPSAGSKFAGLAEASKASYRQWVRGDRKSDDWVSEEQAAEILDCEVSSLEKYRQGTEPKYVEKNDTETRNVFVINSKGHHIHRDPVVRYAYAKWTLTTNPNDSE